MSYRPSTSALLEQSPNQTTTPMAGHVYYVRLTTPVGLMYKLGFTSLGSVQERFAYQAKGHEKLIDRVLLFAFFEDALAMERDLHAHFSSKALFPIEDRHMPFFANGQSEIYCEDILGLDGKFKQAQSIETRQNIRVATAKRMGASDEQLHELHKANEASLANAWRHGVDDADAAKKTALPLHWRVLGKLLGGVLFVLTASFKLVHKIFYETENSRHAEERANFAQARLREAAAQERLNRRKELDRLIRELETTS